jgi:hypothetical protein
VQGLALGRVIWTEQFCQDLWFFIKNNDAVLAIFFCHELHPYSRWKRFVVKLSGSLANFGMACMFLDYRSCSAPSGDQSSWLLECDKGEGQVLQAVSLTCAICVSVLLFLMYWFYTCRCARPGGPLHFGKATENCLVCCTKPIVCSFMAICLCIFGTGVLIHQESDLKLKESHIPRVWATSEFYAFFMGIGTQFLIFLSLYCGCPCCNTLFRECWGSGQGGGARPAFCYPHGGEYPKDQDMMWGGDRSCGTYGHQGSATRV